MTRDDGSFMCRVSISNKEISFSFVREIISRLNAVSAESTAAAIQQAIFEKNTDQASRPS